MNSLRNSLRSSLQRDSAQQQVLTLSLLRSMLPDEWDCPRDNEHGIQSDGLYLRCASSTNSDPNSVRMIQANRSIKISTLIPIVNSTRPERQMQMNENSNHSHTYLAPPTQLSRQSSSASSASDLDYVYYFEVFLISGVFSVGFSGDRGDGGSGGIHINEGLGTGHEPIGLQVNGDLWIEGIRFANWTQPFRTGDTIGCGIVLGSNAKYFFTRNGEEIHSPGSSANLKLPSTQTPLVPCVAVPSSTETVVRTNFGFNREHCFVWRGKEKVRIICQLGPTGHASPMFDDSIRSDDAFLPPDLIRGHTISGDRRDVPPQVECADGRGSSEQSGTSARSPLAHTRAVRRHSELIPNSLHASRTDGAIDIDIDQLSSLFAETENNGHHVSSQSIQTDMNDDVEKQQDLAGTPSLDLNDIKELARELRNATNAEDPHVGALSQLVDVCRTNIEQLNETVQQATMGMECGHDLGELLTVHEMVTDAMQAAEKKKTEMENGISARARHDIFSMLCHLRGQKQKRYDAVWGLLRLTKQGTNVTRCNEVIAAGGMSSLLTLFRESNDSMELMMVSALTVVYLLPSLLDSEVQPSSYINFGMIECLQFLIQASSEDNEVDISPAEIRAASAFAMTNLWFKVLVAKLRTNSMSLAIDRFGPGQPKQDPLSGDRRRFSSVRRRSSLSSQPGDDADSSFLIDAFTSLTISAAVTEASRYDGGQAIDMNVYYEFALIVESVCAVEFARPLAMKEGVLDLLLSWLTSGNMELERPAANTLRNLTLTHDKYTAGWVHCELLNKGALASIAQRLESDDSGVRLAMAQIISSLTIAPHTRDGVIDAGSIKYLVQLLGSIDIQNEEVALAAGHALLRLATGASSRPTGTMGYVFRTQKKECIVDDIVQSGALNSLVSMAKAENYSNLRFLSAKMLRVISEGCKGHPHPGKEKQLCDAEAVTALGNILGDDITFIRSSIENSMATTDSSDLINDSLSNEFLTSTMLHSAGDAMNEVRYVLRGLVNILNSSSSTTHVGNYVTEHLMIKFRACAQLIASDGFKSLLWIASMKKDVCSKLDKITQEPKLSHDIQVDTCQALSSLCPLLLAPQNGQTWTKWAPSVLSALVNFLKNKTLVIIPTSSVIGNIPYIYVDVLQGIGCLAGCEPLKTRIIDRFMLHLLELHKHDDRNVSDAAIQVCLTLGFNEAEYGSNDAYLLGDMFILARSRLLQAMIRDEIRQLMREAWMPALKEIQQELREENEDTEGGDISGNELVSLFQNLCQDQDTSGLREKVRQQFQNVYDCNLELPSPGTVRSSTSFGRKPIRRTMHRSGSYADGEDYTTFRNTPRSHSAGSSTNHMEDLVSELSENVGEDSAVSHENNFLGCHQYPLNGSIAEKDWMIEHCQALNRGLADHPLASPCLRGRLRDALRVCFPSALIRDSVIPVSGFAPNASFDFHAFAMPSGRYYSFRREAQLISEECSSLQSRERVHCSLSFRNSSFAGEFVESLLQALYMCPIIQGLSFSNDAFGEQSVFEGSELLPFLARATPSSVTHLTFDKALSQNAAQSLAHILQSADDDGDEETVGSVISLSVKGSFHSLAIINSPHINSSFFLALADCIHDSSALQFLHTLDLSGNLLGDDTSAIILSMALSSSTSTSINRLDLSRNDIRDGSAVKKVLEECVSSDPKLEVLNLSYNKFGEFSEVATQLAVALGGVLSRLVTLDLSGNDLSGNFLITLGGVFALNGSIVNLNISNNKFSASSINTFLTQLHSIHKNSGFTPLSFVDLGRNVPQLESNQEMLLNEILSTNRRRKVRAYLKEESDIASASLSDITGEPQTDRKSPPAETITVLFSAPLVWRDGDNAYHPIEMLDFQLEKSLLWKCFTEASRNIDLSFDNATTDRLQAVMTRGVKCLHFSGHGHPYCLTFEDGSGGIHWVSVDQLKELISGGVGDGKPPFQFAFVSACHSALAGHTFVDCGVPHVVCCQQESQLMDSAALSFTRAFYLALAFGRTVKESFDIGKNAVSCAATVPNSSEEKEKFMLLPEDGNHDVPIFTAEEVPQWPLKNANSSNRDFNDTLPATPQGFIGRESDLYHALNLVLNRRLVNIVGPTGMGRGSLAAALCHYIDDRKSTLLFDDIYFVKPVLQRPGARKSSPIITLHDQLVLAGKAGEVSQDTDLDEVVKAILLSLKQTKSLLVFDKMETLDGTTDAQDFHYFLGQILEQTKDVSVLITSNESIGLTSLGVAESVYNLGPLNFRNTVKLFAFHCPHLHSARERKELLEDLASHAILNRLAEDDEFSAEIMPKLGGGIPAKTFAVAYEMTAENFSLLKQAAKDRKEKEEQEQEEVSAIVEVTADEN